MHSDASDGVFSCQPPNHTECSVAIQSQADSDARWDKLQVEGGTVELFEADTFLEHSFFHGVELREHTGKEQVFSVSSLLRAKAKVLPGGRRPHMVVEREHLAWRCLTEEDCAKGWLIVHAGVRRI